jgi:hypothetical protein
MDLNMHPEDMGYVFNCHTCLDNGDNCRGDKECNVIREMTDAEKTEYAKHGSVGYSRMRGV